MPEEPINKSTFTFPNTPLTVNRMGYGAMQLAGPGVFGPPHDIDAALAVLREAVDSGVNHIDTSDYYGPHITNQIIKQALHPYTNGLVIVTKVGARRGSDKSWIPALSRQELIDAVHDNLRNLGLDTLDIVNLRVGGAMGQRCRLHLRGSSSALPTCCSFRGRLLSRIYARIFRLRRSRFRRSCLSNLTQSATNKTNLDIRRKRVKKEELYMRADIVPGAVFPDYELPDHTTKRRKLSELQGPDPLIVVLSRGGFCPKDQRQHEGLVQLHRELEVGYCRLVTISTDNITETNEYRNGLDAHWPFLSDNGRTVQKDLDIAEYTDTVHKPMIPHTIVLEPGLVVYKVYVGYWFFGRPTVEELRQDLRSVLMKCRPDWDITKPELKAAWAEGRKEQFYPYGKTFLQTLREQD
jgi:peroxiredoxin